MGIQILLGFWAHQAPNLADLLSLLMFVTLRDIFTNGPQMWNHGSSDELFSFFFFFFFSSSSPPPPPPPPHLYLFGSKMTFVGIRGWGGWGELYCA